MKELPDLSGQYMSTRQDTLTDGVRRVEKISADLGEAGDSANRETTRDATLRLEKALDLIRGLYPAGVVPPRDGTVTYTCPMHPDVQETAAGKCPDCGMSLVVAVPGQGADVKAQGASAETHPGHDKPHMDHKPRHGGLFGMDGDHHLELVMEDDGLMEVYVYDAWTRPLDVSSGRANVVLEIPGRKRPLVVPLKPRAGGSAFVGKSLVTRRAVSATIKVSLGKALLSMTFPIDRVRRSS